MRKFGSYREQDNDVQSERHDEQIEALCAVKAFHKQLYKEDRSNFDDLVKKVEVFLIDGLNSYIHTKTSFFVEIDKCDKIYRCRNANLEIDMKFEELTSPPVKHTRSLRMSRKGVSYFYGSLDENTAKCEALLPDCKYSYMACFKPQKRLVLFDLTATPAEVDYNDDVSRISEALLKYYSEYVSRPNDDDSEDYLPTQVITYFIKECVKCYSGGDRKNVDGILYRSSKTGEKNVVLFYDNEGSKSVLTLDNCYKQ